ncbi:MAG TPA: AI-2E family transporter [Candidatus Kapabacteria bacterium]|nr:AI-2E family transporter [Candidatus Kapabacteria bacterium]
MPAEPSNDLTRTFQRTLVVIGVIAGVAILWIAHEVFLLIFAGLLLGILLDGLAALVARWVHVARGWSLVITILLISGIIAVMVNLVAPGIIAQVRTLRIELPKSIDQIRTYLGQFGWGREILQHGGAFGHWRTLAYGGDSSELVSRMTGAVSLTVGFAVRVVLVIVLGIYAAVEPSIYRLGFLRLFTRRDVEQMEFILGAVHNRMWWWLLSAGGSMLSLTILAFIGLRILGIPMAFTLALLTGLITFIPNFGAFLSAIPPVLVGLMESPEKAIAVVVMYAIIQFLEGNLITPLIQRKTIRMPPVLGIGAQLTMGLLFGFLGLLLAAPLMAGILAILSSVSGERVLVPEELSREPLK